MGYKVKYLLVGVLLISCLFGVVCMLFGLVKVCEKLNVWTSVHYLCACAEEFLEIGVS